MQHEKNDGFEAPVEAAEQRHTHRELASPPLNLKHGVCQVLAGGPLPPGAELIGQQVEQIVQEMIVDLGGEDAVTAQQRAILGGQRLALTVILLGEAYLRARGVIDKNGRPRNILRILGTYVNCLRQGAVALGLERRAKSSAITIDEVVAEIVAKREVKEPNGGENKA